MQYSNENTAKTEIMGTLLELNTGIGLKAIGNAIESSTINRCKNECNANYEMQLPSSVPRPSREPRLGKENLPAQTCADIKEWGAYL